MTMYKHQIDNNWKEWKLLVPRNKSLEALVIELIEADTEDQITEREEQVTCLG